MTMNYFLCVLTVIGLATTTWAAEKIGYQDTPLVPGTKWHVHDGERPEPTIVTPGRSFSHRAPAPSDAVVVFDGKDLSKTIEDMWRRKGELVAASQGKAVSA